MQQFLNKLHATFYLLLKIKPHTVTLYKPNVYNDKLASIMIKTLMQANVIIYLPMLLNYSMSLFYLWLKSLTQPLSIAPMSNDKSNDKNI